MEKRTMGSFMAALRKANGLTQKDLAEKLNVSDKTISRWERDEGAPDLSAIPVIAEIFGITCDELLRGERKPVAEGVERQEEKEATAKGEKQRQRLLKATFSQFQTRTYISMGVSVVGMIAALIGNLALLRAVLGFLLGTVFFVASVVCQIIFTNRAFFSVEDAGLEEKDLSFFKKNVLRLTQRSLGLTVSFVGFTAPLLLVDAYVGLSANNMLLFGIPGAALCILVYAVVCYFLNASYIKKGTYTLDEKEAADYWYNHRLKRNCAVVLVVIFAATLLGHMAATTIYGPWSIMEGTVFNDYESFIEFMEQDIRYQPERDEYVIVDAEAEATPVDDTIYYDEFGNEVSRDVALRRKLEDKNGKVVCTYIDRNEMVSSMRYTAKEGTILPITVCTQDDLREAEEKVAVRNVIFGVLYCIEVVAILLLYFKKREK